MEHMADYGIRRRERRGRGGRRKKKKRKNQTTWRRISRVRNLIVQMEGGDTAKK